MGESYQQAKEGQPTANGQCRAVNRLSGRHTGNPDDEGEDDYHGENTIPEYAVASANARVAADASTSAYRRSR